MKTIHVLPLEMWNDAEQIFEYGPEGSFTFEHSLAAIFKWEGKYKKPFFNPNKSSDNITIDEYKDYLKMAVVEGDPSLIDYLSKENYEEIKDYIGDSCTASTIIDRDQNKHGSGGKSSQFMTSELIYSYMVGLRIPFEAQYWNINRLLILIRMCNEQNQPKKKMPKEKNISQMAALNKARRAKHGTSG